MKKLLIIFEDDRRSNFASLNLLRPTYFLKSGMTELWMAIKRGFPGSDLRFESLSEHEYIVKRHTGLPVNHFDFQDYDRVTLINGRVYPTPEFVDLLESCDLETAFMSRGTVGAVVFSGDSDCAREYGQIEHELEKYAPFASSCKNVSDFAFERYDYIWDLMTRSPENISRDYEYAIRDVGAALGANRANTLVGSHAIAPEQIYIHPEAEVLPGVVLDATGGPIYIDAEARVEPHSYITGPFYLGEGASLLGGRFAGSSVGAVSQIGGELEESVLQGYVNKHHSGFIGHSYVGSWVNFGALTTNSDLKNNYSPVRVSVEGELIDTGVAKIGSFIGDYTKFGIGTLLNTGINIGAFCNIFGGELVSDKEVASFSWGASGSWEEHDVDKALQTARRAMKRRSQSLEPEDEELIRQIFKAARQ